MSKCLFPSPKFHKTLNLQCMGKIQAIGKYKKTIEHFESLFKIYKQIPNKSFKNKGKLKLWNSVRNAQRNSNTNLKSKQK